MQRSKCYARAAWRVVGAGSRGISVNVRMCVCVCVQVGCGNMPQGTTACAHMPCGSTAREGFLGHVFELSPKDGQKFPKVH